MSPGNQEDSTIQTGGGAAVGKDVTIGTGDFTGRDRIGFDGAEVSQIIQVLLKHFSAAELKSPLRFDQKLDQIAACHKELYEWKEMHNFLDTTLQHYDQFEQAVRSANHRDPNLQNLKNSWFKIGSNLDDMLRWASGTMQIIGEKIVIHDERGLSVPLWGVKLDQIRYDIDHHLSEGEKLELGSRTGGLLQWVKLSTSLDDYWFRKLQDYSSNYRSLVLQYMHYADDHLRTTASRLYEVTQQSIGGNKNDHLPGSAEKTLCLAGNRIQPPGILSRRGRTGRSIH